MVRGRFISFEGGEGSGKSTQARLLVERLRQAGIDALPTREPGGSDGAEAIRALLLDGAADRWTAEAEALLFAAARADHVARIIIPALEAGRYVVSDRFVDSSRAYQGASGLADADIMALHRFGSGGLLPDLTIWLDLPPAEARARAAVRDGHGGDRIGGREAAFHAAVAARFAAMMKAEPARFVRVDAGRTEAEVGAEIAATLDARGWLA